VLPIPSDDRSDPEGGESQGPDAYHNLPRLTRPHSNFGRPSVQRSAIAIRWRSICRRR